MAIHEKTTGFMAEFRKFIARNVMDMAVGVIVGGAFKAIADSLVADIINPILGIFAGNNDALASLAIQLPGGGALMVGNFINAVINFLDHGLLAVFLVSSRPSTASTGRRRPLLPRLRPPLPKRNCSPRSATC